MITLIAAMDVNNAIGKDGGIPWHIKEDFANFRAVTRRHAVIMGRRTFESLPNGPLPYRFNIVVSQGKVNGVLTVPSVQEAIASAYTIGHKQVFGIGGQRIYEEMLPYASRVLLTKVATKVENADTFFPELDWANWKLSGIRPISTYPLMSYLETYSRF